MSIRPVAFWLHLLVGVTAGTVIAFMSVTGVLLAFEPQITEWLERDRRIVVPPAGAARLPLETLVARAREARPDLPPLDRHAPLRPERRARGELRSRRRCALRRSVPRHRAGRLLPGARRPPRGGRVAPLARRAGRRPADHRRGQPGLPRAGLARRLPLVAAAMDGRRPPAGDSLRSEPARPGPQLQLAQRDRHLVRAGALRDHAHRPRHVLPVGERPRLPADRLRAPAGGGRGAPGAGRRPGPGESRTRRAPGPAGRGPCARRPGRAVGTRGATGAGLGPHQPACPGAAGWPGHLRHPGAEGMASDAPLPAHPRPDHRRDRPLGAVRRPEPRAAPAELGSTAARRRGRRGGGPGARADSPRAAGRSWCGPASRWPGAGTKPGAGG